MIDQRLIEYIKRERAKGITNEQIKSVLLSNGWKEADMPSIFESANTPTTPFKPQQQFQPQPQPQQPQVQLNPQSPVQPKPTVMTYRKRMPLAFKLFIVFMILAIVGGGGFYYAYRVFNFPWNLFRPAPESVIAKAWNNIKTINSQNFDFELLLSGKTIEDNKQTSAFDVTIKSSGGIDIDKNLSLIKASVKASISDDNLPGEYKLSLSGETRSIKNDLYFEFNEIDLGGLEAFLMMFIGVDVKEFKNRWIRVQVAELFKEQLKEQLKQQIEEGKKEQTAMEKDAKELMNKIVNILLDKKVYDIEQLPDNQGTDGKEYHYYISLNREKLISVSPEIFNLSKEYEDKYNSNLPDSEDYTLENFQKDINEMFDKVGVMAVDVFIGKDDGFFHKIQFVKDLDISKFNEDSNLKGNVRINWRIEQTGINKPVQVSAPEKYEDIKDVISPFFIKSDISQLFLKAQQICLTNKSCYSLCKNNLLNGYQSVYGKTLIDINGAIMDQGGTMPICFSNTKDYCVSTQLKDSSWLCTSANSAGKIGSTKCLSAKTVCQ